MKAQERREDIIQTLISLNEPITASDLADKYAVSRQVIVGDIALLRARNYQIMATNQGYILVDQFRSHSAHRYTGRLACQHDASQTEQELQIILDQGGVIEDVIIDHPIYGILTAALRIATRVDLDRFLSQMAENQGELLSTLTQGVHVHTINTPSIKEFQAIVTELNRVGILLTEE